MSKRLAPVCLMLLALLLTGCGGGDTTPTILTGDYFPLTVGRVWTFDLELEVETPWQLFVTTGTFTRTLTGIVPITIDGATVNAYEFTQTTTVADVPTGSDVGPVTHPIVRAVNTLFTPGHGLQPVRAYYTEGPGPGPVGTTQITLVAIAENGGAITPLTGDRPLLLNPPQDGYGVTANHCFLPLPLMPPSHTLSDYLQRSKTLAYVIDPSPAAVVEIYSFSARFALGDVTGEFGGRGRTMLIRDLGLGEAAGSITDWYANMYVGDEWARLNTRVTPR